MHQLLSQTKQTQLWGIKFNLKYLITDLGIGNKEYKHLALKEGLPLSPAHLHCRPLLTWLLLQIMPPLSLW